jgi:ubiquinone/menaquinone biosynthesis C-methylase UbiE/uncharacterized protein YbaR (Trm112 family)
MQRKHLHYLACPACKGELSICVVEREQNDRIEEGTLECLTCGQQYPILRHVPRFVALENYASNFGLQWNLHAKTQFDSFTGVNISEARFFAETNWSRTIVGELILEAGSGAGRFTEQAVSTGAMVISLDYSVAVDANYLSNGHNDNLLIVQGDIYHLPFRENSFDRVVCIGVLQHTPDVKAAFMSLTRQVKPGGNLIVDFYPKETSVRGAIKHLLRTKYWIRPLTRKLSPESLYRWCKGYVSLMWPLARYINRVPRIGRNLNWSLMIADYRGRLPLPDEVLKEWAILDTFDMLAPAYDQPQTVETVRRWFQEADMVHIEVMLGCEDVFKGVLGRGTKPT